MNIIESLELYTASQKLLAYRFFAIGVFLTACFLVVTFMSSLDSPLWRGFRIGSAVCALLIIGFSVVYINFSNTTHADLLERHAADQVSMVEFELARMEKIVKEFPYYQALFTIVVLVGLALLVFASPFWQGIGFSVAAMHTTMLFFELDSKAAILRHFKFVEGL